MISGVGGGIPVTRVSMGGGGTKCHHSHSAQYSITTITAIPIFFKQTRNHFVRNCLLLWGVAWLVLEDTDACNYFQVVVQGAGGALTHG